VTGIDTAGITGTEDRLDDERATGVVEALADPVFVVTEAGRIDGWNAAARAATGHDEPTLIDAPLSLLFDDHAVARVETALARAEDRDETVETALVAADGTRVPHDFEVVVLPDGDRALVGRPVTDHQRALDRVSDAFLSVDRDWRLTYLNASAFSALAAATPDDPEDRSDLLGRHLWKLVPAAVDTEFYDRYHEAVETGDPVSFEAAYDPLGVVFEVRAYPSDDGLSVYFRDVTARHEQAAALERRATTLREMYEVVADRSLSSAEQVEELLALCCATLDTDYGFLSRIEGDEWTAEAVHDPTGRFEPGFTVPLSAANCERVVTDSETVVAGDVARDAADLADRAAFEEFGLACYLGAPVRAGESLYGTLCFYDPTPRDQFDDWDVTVVDLAARWVSYELERRRHTDRLERQNTRLDRFASFVSHDLRSPLAALRGRLDLAEETGDAEQFAACRRVVDRMERLTDDLLALARAGDLAAERETVDLGTVAERAWATVEADDATLRVAPDRSLVAEPGALERLLANLFANSVEHGSPDHRAVTVTVRATDDGFVVADDGSGVPPDERDRVLESGYTTDPDGTGLGLAIVREVVESHGWTVALAGSVDGGLRVEVGGV
jgi:signal transduction histidine kinase